MFTCVCLFFCFQQCRVRFFENEIEFRLLKKQCKLHNDSEGVCHSVPLAGSWPRLQSSHHRPHWLKPDFDRWEVSESEEEEEEDTEKSKEEKMKELMVQLSVCVTSDIVCVGV